MDNQKRQLTRCPYRKSITTWTHADTEDTEEDFAQCHGPACALYDERFPRNCARAAKEIKDAMHLLTFNELAGTKERKQ